MEVIGMGGECTVWKNSKGVFKEYHTRQDADDAQKWQFELSVYDLAPEVYSRVCRVRMKNGKLTGWGYYTEEAECFSSEQMDLWYGDEIPEPEPEDIEFDRMAVDENLMINLGFEYVDFHLGNYGYVYRNGVRKMVIVDTGKRGFIEITEDKLYGPNHCNSYHYAYVR